MSRTLLKKTAAGQALAYAPCGQVLAVARAPAHSTAPHTAKGKARILLKADVSEGGPGWSDSKIIAALDTSASMLYRVRKQLEEGLETVLSRKQRATPAVARIFDGEKEAKLIALDCSKPPERTCALDAAAVGEQGRGTGHRRSRWYWRLLGVGDRGR